MLAEALKANVGFGEYSTAIESWMRESCERRGIPNQRVDEHVATQMARVCDLATYFDD